MMMPLEQQVSNREISQRLKELGVPQESKFYWNWHNWSPRDARLYFEPSDPEDAEGHHFVSAFTVAELGKMLPPGFSSGRPFGKDLFECWPTFDAMTTEEECEYQSRFRKVPFDQERNEADVRAKMLIYLIENKLVTP